MTESLGVAEANPLRQSLPRTRVPEPCAVVLFGATGDLTHRKLVPGAVSPGAGGNLPAEFAIVGFARRDWTDDELRDELEKSLAKSGDPDFAQIWPQFASHIVFAPGTFDDPAGYAKLKERLEQLDAHARHARQPALLPGRRPRVLRDDHRPPRQGRADLPARTRTSPGAGSSSRSRSATTWPAPAP